jgi:hypothetical protein
MATAPVFSPRELLRSLEEKERRWGEQENGQSNGGISKPSLSSVTRTEQTPPVEDFSPEVGAFLDRYLFLAPLLKESVDPVREIFGAQLLVSLTVGTDPEVTDGEYLVIGFRTMLPTDQAQEQLDAFEAAWWLKNGPRAKGKLRFKLEPVSPEVSKRLKGHEQLVQDICVLARQEARRRGLTLYKMDIRPAWSHESDEQTGIIIDLEVKATANERFAYWDAVCEQVSQLEASLSPEDQRFLGDDIALLVSRN